MPDGSTNRALPSSTSHLQNSRHVELVRAYRLEQSGWRFESSGPPRTPALHEICPPNTREFARAHRPTFESLRGKAVWGVSRSAGNARPETRFLQADNGSASFRLDVRRPDHLAPLLGFLGHQLDEIGGRARKHSTPQVSESRLHLRVGESGVDFRVEPIDDFGGCVFGRANAIPTTRLVARNEIAHGRDVWQHLQSCRGCHGQRPKLAGSDMPDRRRNRVEHGLNLARNEIGQRRARAAIVYLDHIDARHHLKQFSIKMWCAPRPG